MNELAKGEIVLCNLKFKHNRKSYYIKDVVYKYTDGYYRRARVLSKLNIHDKVKIDELEIIRRMGFENKSLSNK